MNDNPFYFLDRHEVSKVLAAKGRVPKKRLGQNYLCSAPVIAKIVDLCAFERGDRVLEIGAGLGSFTFNIASRVEKLVVIEVDGAACEFLEAKKQEINQDNVEIIHADALSIDFPGETTKIFSAMPYSIAAPLVFKILEFITSQRELCSAFLIAQREFVDKLVARPGTREYSRISANVAFFAEVETLLDISRQNFHPVPKVDSTFFKLIPAKKFPGHLLEPALELTRLLFPYKNKLVRRAVHHALKALNNRSLEQGNLAAGNELSTVPHGSRRVRDLGPNELRDLIEWFQAINVNFKEDGE